MGCVQGEKGRRLKKGEGTDRTFWDKRALKREKIRKREKENHKGNAVKRHGLC
jgi:hypothetical protein